jgi:hypothetical protein
MEPSRQKIIGFKVSRVQGFEEKDLNENYEL